MNTAKTRLTVDLPRELVKWADTVVQRGAARSRNQLIAQAIDVYLHSLEEAEIHARFKAMADDETYQRMTLQLTQELEHSDWEALQLGEGQGGRAHQGFGGADGTDSSGGQDSAACAVG